MPAAEMRRFDRALPSDPFAFTLAQRAFWVADMRRRAAGDIVRPRVGCGALPLSDASAAIALSKPLRSGWSSLIAESRFAIRDCSTVIGDCSQAYEPQQNRSPLAPVAAA
jgi:hypothetical protein